CRIRLTFIFRRINMLDTTSDTSTPSDISTPSNTSTNAAIIKNEATQTIDTFPNSELLKNSEVINDDSADWHINSEGMKKSINAVLGRKADAELSIEDLKIYRAAIKEAIMHIPNMTQNFADCTADIMERSAFFTLAQNSLSQSVEIIAARYVTYYDDL